MKGLNGLLIITFAVLCAITIVNSSNSESNESSNSANQQESQNERSNDIHKKNSNYGAFASATDERSIVGTLINKGKSIWNVIPSPRQVFSFSFKSLFALPQSAVIYSLDTICTYYCPKIPLKLNLYTLFVVRYRCYCK